MVSMVALIAVLVLMGANQRWFARNYVFYSRFSTADGVTTGMRVRLKGFEIGKVVKVKLNSYNRVRVDIAIYEDYYDKIRPDSVVDLATDPLGLGAGSLNLLPGLNQLPPMEEHSFLPSTESNLGKALMAEGVVDKPLANGAIAGIISQIEPLLVEVRGTAAAVTHFLGDINGAVEGRSKNQISALMTTIQATMGTIESVLSSTGANANTLMVSGRDLMKNLNGITGNIDRLSSQLQDPKGLIPKLLDPQGSLKTFLDDKNQLYNQFTQILAQVNDTLGQVKGLAQYLNQSTPMISGLMEDTQTTLKKTSNVMEGLSNNPLLRGGIPAAKPQTSTLQGARDESF